jgi:hypothetical protein
MTANHTMAKCCYIYQLAGTEGLRIFMFIKTNYYFEFIHPEELENK